MTPKSGAAKKMNIISYSEFHLLTPVLFDCGYTTLAFIIFIVIFITNADSSSIKNNNSHSHIHGFRVRGFIFLRRLSENALFSKLCVMLKKLSSKYQLYVCGNFLSKP